MELLAQSIWQFDLFEILLSPNCINKQCNYFNIRASKLFSKM